MRVLVVTNQFPIPSRPSYGIFVAEQVRSLRSAGLQVDVLFFNPKKTRLNYGLSLPRVIRALRSSRYDIVHTHHTYSMVLVDVARRLAGPRVPVVLTNHEEEVTDREKKTRTWRPTSQLRHSLLLKRFVARRADFVVFVSDQMATLFSSNVPHEVIPCGVDLTKFRPLDRSLCRGRLSVPDDAVVIFFPASPQAEGKRFALAEAAYRIVRERHPHSLLLTAGAISHDLMPIYYNAADVVLQASFYEASPTVVKEALACEVPLVSTDSGDTRETVKGVPYCFVCADDPFELANHALMCLGHRAVGGRQQLLSKDLGLEQIAQKLIRVYQQVATASRSRCVSA